MVHAASTVRDDTFATRPRRAPLYLNVTQVTTVTLDGPALRVTASGRSVSRYPIERIARVVTRGPVQWRTEALCALMQSGIPVIIVGAGGKPTGYCWPVGRSPVPLAARLGELLDRKGWQVSYRNWLKAQRMRILSEWRHGREQAGHPVPDWQFTALVRSHVYASEWREKDKEDSLRRGSIVAIVASQVAQAGLHPEYWAWGGTQLDLVSDLADLLELLLCLNLGGFGAAMRGEEPARFWVLSPVYGQLSEHCTEILGQFARWIREVTASWH